MTERPDFEISENAIVPECRCGESLGVTDFRDVESLREFEISGYCQVCQDLIWIALSVPTGDEPSQAYRLRSGLVFASSEADREVVCVPFLFGAPGRGVGWDLRRIVRVGHPLRSLIRRCTWQRSDGFSSRIRYRSLTRPIRPIRFWPGFVTRLWSWVFSLESCPPSPGCAPLSASGIAIRSISPGRMFRRKWISPPLCAISVLTPSTCRGPDRRARCARLRGSSPSSSCRRPRVGASWTLPWPRMCAASRLLHRPWSTDGGLLRELSVFSFGQLVSSALRVLFVFSPLLHVE